MVVVVLLVLVEEGFEPRRCTRGAITGRVLLDVVNADIDLDQEVSMFRIPSKVITESLTSLPSHAEPSIEYSVHIVKYKQKNENVVRIET